MERNEAHDDWVYLSMSYIFTTCRANGSLVPTDVKHGRLAHDCHTVADPRYMEFLPSKLLTFSLSLPLLLSHCLPDGLCLVSMHWLFLCFPTP